MDKNGSDVLSGAGRISPRMVSSLDGNTIAFASTGGFPGSQGAVITSYYSASRGGPEGWTTTGLVPRLAPFSGPMYGSTLGISPDGTKAVVGSLAALAPGAVEGDGNLYLRDVRSGSYELIATSPDAAFQTVIGLNYFVVGGSPDFSRVFFSTAVALTPDAYDGGDPTRNFNIYEWRNHRLALISKSPSGTPFNAALLGGTTRQPRFVSDDGSRVYFTDPSGSDGRGPMVYLWENGVTRAVTVSHRSVAPLPPGALINPGFAAASADGRRMVFATIAPMLDEPYQHFPQLDYLYLYDIADDSLTNLAGTDLEEPLLNRAGITVFATNDDLTWVYFTSPRVFVTGAVVGEDNLYAWHDGEVRLVATRGDADVDSTKSDPTPFAGPNGDLAFAARTPLTGYDNSNPGCTEGRCSEVFVYQAERGVLTCASCPGAGVAATGDAAVGGQTLATAAFSHFGRAVVPGGRVYFDTPQALAAGDVNGKRDVYEFRDGQVSLISTGHGRDDAWFADASVSGDDVFITTAQRLVGQDRDDMIDLYDVRVDGGIASQAGRNRDAACSGDGCQGPASAGPAVGDAGSATFAGAGNVARVPAGRVRPSVRVAAPRPARGVAVSLRVKVAGGAGAVTVSGGSVRAVRRTVARAGTYAVRVVLKPAAQRTLARRGRVRTAVRVAFKPKTGRSVSRRVTVTFARAAKGGRS